MSNRKIIFFDIDGTLWDFHNTIPESTVRAIRTLRANGHLAFLCSGRTRAFIKEPHLLAIGFDGIVSGCGTIIEYEDRADDGANDGTNVDGTAQGAGVMSSNTQGGEGFHGRTIYNCEISVSDAARTLTTLRRYGFRPILEGKDHLYLDYEEFCDDAYGRKVIREMGDRLLPIRENWGSWHINKLACATDRLTPEARQACFTELSDLYDYIIHNEDVVEFVPKGHSKGSGMRKVREYLNQTEDLFTPADVFAFGDSANDLEMFREAGTSIAMGNAAPIAKSAADYITTDLHNDGIWNACKHFGLI